MGLHMNLGRVSCWGLMVALWGCSASVEGGARLYRSAPKAPSLDSAAIERLDHLGPTIVDHGVNFGVYSERAERIELLLFDDPEAPVPTRQFPLQRFGDVWNVFVEGIGLGQHYGFIAWGPNWPYDPQWLPGSIKGFKADVDADGNRFNPNKLLWDPYSKAIHRDHDWSKGSLATGPKRSESTWAAASKSIVVQSKYEWSANEATYRTRRMDENSPGHRWNDAIIYELHPKGFSASPASGAQHPGTWRGLGEKVDYLKDLGVTVVHLMPPFEKPSEGGYWGYNSLSFFIPENTYSFRKDQQEIIDEFKWMVDQFHQADIEVLLDVVYNHTGEGGFWRERLESDFNPDPSITPQLTNFDAKEVVGLYNFRGFDNHAYYALTQDKQAFWNNSGVGNETRCNHTPFRRLIIDSLRYWAEEMHVDGFRFDLAPVLGEKDLTYFVWENPKDTVLQDIADDPVLQKYNTRLVSEPWAAGGYDLGQSFNGPNNNELSNGYGTRIGLFPAASNKPGTAWGEWNGRFRDWWRGFWNRDDFRLNSTEVKDGGFFLTGSHDWFAWNSRKPYHSINFVTVHDGFTMYDLFSYDSKQNGCGPLNPICCTEPTSPWCEKVSGEDNNRSRNWAVDTLAVGRQPIPDNGPVLSLSLAATGVGLLKSAKVSMHLTHPDFREVRVELVAPTGNTQVLVNGQDGSASAADLSQEQRWVDGLFHTPVAGTWTLRVMDQKAGNTGTLDSFSLRLESDEGPPELMRRQLMRNLFVSLLISQGTPLLWSGDEWMRTQLGNNNAYSTRADNPFNWMDWGAWLAQDPRHRMHDFVKQIIAFRKAHQYAFAPLEYGQGAPFSWKSAQNTEPADWGSKHLMMHFYNSSAGPELAILINGESREVDFTLPSPRAWKALVDTQSYFDVPETLVKENQPQRSSYNSWLNDPKPVSSSTYTAKPLTIVILEAKN